MYVFISYSWKDRSFARKIYDSLSVYAISVFLDEREIRVGDSIPNKVYEALDRATHVIYVLSRNSIMSRWVNEELSVAKLRQISENSCTVLPVRINKVELPVSIKHIKVADFTRWRSPSRYVSSLKLLLDSLGLHQDHTSTANDLILLRRHLADLLLAKQCADSLGQLFFQLERLWFYLYHEDPNRHVAPTPRTWFRESERKTSPLSQLVSAHDSISSSLQILPEGDFRRTGEIVSACLEVTQACDKFLNADKKEDIYKCIRVGEEKMLFLSSLIRSVLVEIAREGA